jgi:hypothetical protein
MMRERLGVLLVMAVMWSGCGGRQSVDVAAGAGSPEQLGSTLNVRVQGDSVRLTLHITNVTSGPIALEFSSGQRYDFAVSEPGGRSVWRWSADRSFMQMMSADTLRPGESRQYTETWHGTQGDAEYVATGWLTSLNYPVELRTVFRPGG